MQDGGEEGRKEVLLVWSQGGGVCGGGDDVATAWDIPSTKSRCWLESQ